MTLPGGLASCKQKAPAHRHGAWTELTFQLLNHLRGHPLAELRISSGEHDQPAVFGAQYLTREAPHSQTQPYAEPVQSVRQARQSDIADIHRLIVDLATYERSAHEVKARPDDLQTALFGPQPAAYSLVAESDGEVVGFALYFRNFSTWEGVHGIYLEDLYVKPEHRGAGHGKALLRALAALAVERGYARLEWAVLNWNQPSIEFYRSIGAVPMDEWTVYRLTGEPLLRVAGNAA